MSDFHQTGVVATLHRLDTRSPDALEREMETHAARRPIGLILPCLFSEFDRPAIRHIIDELRGARYLERIVVSLGRTRADDLPVAAAAFARLGSKVRFIWNDGPAMQAFYARLLDEGLDVTVDGKGRSLWIACGYLLADGVCSVFASHDCDIATYDRELLARLCYPLVHPSLGFDFVKGYYARVSRRMNGRVTRLFVTPLLRALQPLVGPVPLLAYLDSFRYPLAGEFALTRELALAAQMPASWGVEVGVLAEAFRHAGASRVCQSELAPNYDHKHQPLSALDPGAGLLRMAIEIGQTLLRALAAEGVVVTEALANTLIARYGRVAEDTINGYQADAAINGLVYDRHEEEGMAGVFAKGLALACRRHAANALSVSFIPSWRRVVAAVPNAFDLLRQAVEQDLVSVAA
jgi:glucosyl-3-phosphoglycerate synthase